MNGIYNNPKIQSLLRPEGLLQDPESYNEYAIFCEIIVRKDGKEYILKVKGKLDNFTIDHEKGEVVLNDLKTTGKPVNFLMGSKTKVIEEDIEKYVVYEGSFTKYHYYRQMG